jgi:UV DNA damage endonuclease
MRMRGGERRQHAVRLGLCCQFAREPIKFHTTTATARAVATWNREPVFHISSPLEGWRGPRPERHHDYINPRDFPGLWKGLELTVEVEAKAKELAVMRLLNWLRETKPGRSGTR